MSSFYKNGDCPASHRIAAFQDGEVGRVEARAISAHLRACEFCDAECRFYSRYPPLNEKVPVGKIPQPLFELAAALLGGTAHLPIGQFSYECGHVRDDV